ncbi:hypothetical protein BAC2_01660 [uncultured bacterium]|nr:hypothetical protein BAC2_01660 [uncultured bacterium]
MSPQTHELLIAEFNADLSVRQNIHALQPREVFQVGTSQLTLVPNGHMLGSVQVLVERADGKRLGYSGDFAWPLDPEDVIKCDELVVDSTYGSPGSIRQYSQEDAEARLVELVHAKLRTGAVHVHAHRGTIQRALQLLSTNVNAPVIASERLCQEIAVYQGHGAAVGTVLMSRSSEGVDALRTKRYIRLYSKGDRPPDGSTGGTTISLSAYMVPHRDPVLEYSDRAYKVALSNHADFQGTLDYITATGAKFVVTDNTRTHGVELSQAIEERLGIRSQPSNNHFSREWGC